MSVYKIKGWFVASIGDINACSIDRREAMDLVVKAYLANKGI